MSSETDHSDDLLIRARRNQLEGGEERRLREALASSSETRLLFEAGCAFDREAPMLPGDDARIEGMLRAVQKRRPKPRAQVPPRRVWQALALGLLIGGAAVAAVEGSKSLFRPAALESAGAVALPSAPQNAHNAPPASDASNLGAPSQGTAASPTPPLPARPFVERLALRQAEPEPAVPSASARVVQAVPNPATAVAPNAAGRASARFADVAVADSHVSTAGELFAAANRARMQADSVQAIATYRRLESEYPKSAEALSARLSLGILYLQAGQAGLALEQFRAYGSLGRGPTLGEAAWGESQALSQLGQRAEERRVLQELLERFPESAYAAAARKRLAQP